MIRSFKELLTAAAARQGKRVAIVAPYSAEITAAAQDASEQLGYHCTLIGSRTNIPVSPATASMEILDVPDLNEALRRALQLIRDGHGDILVKGNIDTSALMKAVLQEDNGLRTGRILSDVVAVEYGRDGEQRLLLITDGGVTTAPDLKTKRELILNAVEVAHALGNPEPRVAVLSATEFVNPGMQSTLDAAALAKMNERGQITGCLVEGPLALDNALSAEAAAEKKLRSPVAGHADILLAHSIEVANSLAKGATYFAGLPLAHVIVGARVPVLISSRSDKREARLASIALGGMLG
jgi:phosphate butyryltransferase